MTKLVTVIKCDVVEMFLRYEEKRKAHEVLSELGISYKHVTSHTTVDQVWFWGCDNIPSKLPPYIYIYTVDPYDYIGFCLSKEQADLLLQ